MSAIGVLRLERAPAAQLAAWSQSALDRPLAHDAELLVVEPSDSAIALGALQRVSEVAAHLAPNDVVLRRGSCGAEARVGPGTLWMQLALARPSVLVACEPTRILNRYVRPLLHALAKVGALAHYFDRDWISLEKHPIGMITFAHDATSGRALVEAILAVESPFALRPRGSYLGKAPATIAELSAKVDLPRLAGAIADAYATAYDRTLAPLDQAALGSSLARAEPRDAAWTATRDEAIGLVGAGRDASGRMRIGGELMASRDAIARLEERLAASPTPPDAAAIGRAVDESLQARGVALVGVRSLLSLRDALVEAFASPP